MTLARMLLCSSLFWLGGFSVAKAQEASAPPAAEAPSDEAMIAAWVALTPEQRREASEWFALEARSLPIFQNTLIRYLKGTLDKDPYDWPEPAAQATFDPQVHAPAQPIPRVPVDPASSEYKKEFERLVGWKTPRRLRSAWAYDYAQRSILRIGDPHDPETLFRNGLAGFVPDLDLGEALCQMQLDDGSQQAVHAGFAHTYAQRTGASFPGISLYDAWNSGREIEMPDVECLGLLHTLLNDWKSFKAPVSNQKPLYAKIEALFVPIQRARALQTSLARCFLIATPVLHDGYQGTEAFLHNEWETHQSDPALVRKDLPPSDRWEAWMEKGQKELRKDEAAQAASLNRRQHLAWGESQVRALWVHVLQGMGSLPAPESR
ncbi:MAG: hypothetical protein H6830_04340 [Planctomycetes bacterium]|nr:hypothetical protein [Planctomycetota bacterium]MCB9910464.1 hypothetical protein [Planctomycetota bacterium]MCB9912590.1 hypothetical protein [Planctomycetota bacterium]HPF14916.1 hypothetical protein [Planctomycetota bacterium]HRV82408.1 hypothetical protein [Planctomycetota bacterium]